LSGCRFFFFFFFFFLDKNVVPLRYFLFLADNSSPRISDELDNYASRCDEHAVGPPSRALA